LHLCSIGFVPAIASALATIVMCGLVLMTRTSVLFPSEFFAAIYGGGFVGMTPVLELSDGAAGAAAVPANALFVLLSIVSGLAFYFLRYEYISVLWLNPTGSWFLIYGIVSEIVGILVIRRIASVKL